MIGPPPELMRAKLLLNIMERFGYTLTELRNEDPELLQLLQIEMLGTRKEGEQEWQP